VGVPVLPSVRLPAGPRPSPSAVAIPSRPPAGGATDLPARSRACTAARMCCRRARTGGRFPSHARAASLRRASSMSKLDWTGATCGLACATYMAATLPNGGRTAPNGSETRPVA
jgi:hypothetical protein